MKAQKQKFTKKDNLLQANKSWYVTIADEKVKIGLDAVPMSNKGGSAEELKKATDIAITSGTIPSFEFYENFMNDNR